MSADWRTDEITDPLIADDFARTADPETSSDARASLYPPDTRWFDGRPVRPARTVWMVVTAYSPDSRSCGKFADGKTATMHSVWTNAMRLAAADPKLLPYGSMISVPGYDKGAIVPVLDCGGKIKGARLDMLMPDHETARRWGKRRLAVTIWEYADGKPAPDVRKTRDSE